MRICPSGAHFGCDPDGLHEFGRRSAGSEGSFGVALDAVWALCDMSHCHGNDLLHFCAQRPVSENLAAESVKRGFGLGGEVAPLGG
jgi:hypothetical protein